MHLFLRVVEVVGFLGAYICTLHTPGGGKECVTLVRCAAGGVAHYEAKRLRYYSSVMVVVA